MRWIWRLVTVLALVGLGAWSYRPSARPDLTLPSPPAATPSWPTPGVVPGPAIVSPPPEVEGRPSPAATTPATPTQEMGDGLPAAETGPGAPAGDPPFAGRDIAETMAKSGLAPWRIPLHPDARVGQWGEWEMGRDREWCAITDERGGLLVVEVRRDAVMVSDVTFAYLVDRDGIVCAAWIALRARDGEPRRGYPGRVAPRPADTPASGPPPAAQGTETLTAAGREWRCTWVRETDADDAATTWMADDAWFSRIVQVSQSGDVTMRLVATGTDAKPGLRIP